MPNKLTKISYLMIVTQRYVYTNFHEMRENMLLTVARRGHMMIQGSPSRDTKMKILLISALECVTLIGNAYICYNIVVLFGISHCYVKKFSYFLYYLPLYSSVRKKTNCRGKLIMTWNIVCWARAILGIIFPGTWAIFSIFISGTVGRRLENINARKTGQGKSPFIHMVPS